MTELMRTTAGKKESNGLEQKISLVIDCIAAINKFGNKVIQIVNIRFSPS
jgi:hypothetical protein